MKKVLSLFLVAVMVVSLCGCTGGDTDKPEFSMGEITNNTYKNDFLGLKCALPYGWSFYTQEEILKMNSIVSGVLDEEAAEQLKNADLVYDMVASQTDGSSMNVVMEKLGADKTLWPDIKARLEEQIPTIRSSYRKMGYTDIKVEHQTVEVSGKEFDGLKITAKIYGTAFYGTTFAFKKGDYIVSVAVCSLRTDKAGDTLFYFTVE